ncbi:MAG: type II toxin-antitoxin system PemK/MazF family toxin [Lamprobacter sp.]|uniref:type II toxin-antitoxin system PemK/MazF family toxin n=1 Tax=Lamprobacter sp. TaxID=3100796 RepID=UPI002B25AE5A|nr:type II toxin-antitoxin system PemK/MazF family toxin [Lamprobacter sp.]MEA3643851.1 type II toxin-antitoxin system PemK/MazF family toxin [Lamprobacter sp.]
MINFEAGDVVLVPFPFTDLIGLKKRPSVVVSSAAYQQRRRDAILMAITSRVRTPLDFAEAEIVHWQASGLLKPSLFKPLLFSLEQKRILRRMGSLQPHDRENLHAILGQIIG